MDTIKGFLYRDILGGYTEGITRRDPSPVVKWENRYYLWYSRTTETAGGYTATIWYADSTDGFEWTERGQALARGSVGAWDEHAVFTPSILFFDGIYYLSYTAVAEPFSSGSEGEGDISPTAIGLAKAQTPLGPWVRVSPDPILSVDSDPARFDSLRVDDSCFLIRDNRIHLYYKGRQIEHSPMETKMGLATASHPGGPYLKSSGRWGPRGLRLARRKGSGLSSLPSGPRRQHPSIQSRWYQFFQSPGHRTAQSSRSFAHRWLEK